MPFIINKYGEKVHVDVDVDWFLQKCALYADGAELKDVWILNLYKGIFTTHDKEPELVKQIQLHKEPLKEQVMYYLHQEGLGRYDIATVEKGYMLDWEENKEEDDGQKEELINGEI